MLKLLLRPLLLVGSITLLAGCPQPDAIIKTDLGLLRGNLEANNKVVSWKGVPYAQAPVGPLRWQAPHPVQPWKGIRDATDYGNSCMQIGSLYGPAAPGHKVDLSLRDTLGQPIGSEDCLYLNIWRPANFDRDLPVVLFIHGGSNMVGTSTYYHGTELAQQGVLFISINYRLNLFGWLNHPALKQADAPEGSLNQLSNSGNFGTLDQIQALQFVHQYIAEFGGDPNNVTIMGQSAGGAGVFALMVSPLAHDLFQKAVMLSPALLNQAPETSYNYANGLLIALAIQSGLATDADSATAWLAAQTPEQLHDFLYSQTPEALESATQLDPRLALTPAILRDGVVEPENPSATVASGEFNNVPVIMGVTAEEGKLFTRGATLASDYDRWTYMQTFNPDDPASTPVTLDQLIKPEFLPADLPQQGTCGADDFVYGGYNDFANHCGALITTDQFTAIQDQYLLPLLASQQSALYAYRWSWNQQPEPWRTFYGAAHAGDISFMLGMFDTAFFANGYSQANAEGRMALSHVMVSSLVSFAHTGDPNNPALTPGWLPWSVQPDGPKRLQLDADDQNAEVEIQ